MQLREELLLIIIRLTRCPIAFSQKWEMGNQRILLNRSKLEPVLLQSHFNLRWGWNRLLPI